LLSAFELSPVPLRLEFRNSAQIFFVPNNGEANMEQREFSELRF
jgi:hypothetical protein